ncbi:hypothetical protein CFB89_23600 [Burkholderia sp. AU16741]|nr:hypothetical protein CFB89_23600 [Burkholderia sp. AU16741]
MNSDDSSRLPLAGATLRIDTPSASCAPASVPAFTDPQPIAPDATRRGALARRYRRGRSPPAASCARSDS